MPGVGPDPEGRTALVVTELYKTGSPQFRYNIMDLSWLYPRERCACGSWLRRMGPAHSSHINFRGTFSFSVDKYAQALLRSPPASRRSATA